MTEEIKIQQNICQTLNRKLYEKREEIIKFETILDHYVKVSFDVEILRDECNYANKHNLSQSKQEIIDYLKEFREEEENLKNDFVIELKKLGQLRKNLSKE